MLNMALLLRVVNEGEPVVVNQVVEEVEPSVEVGVDIGGTTPDPDFSVNEGKPQMHTTLPCIVDTKCDTLCLTHSKPESVASIGFPGAS